MKTQNMCRHYPWLRGISVEGGQNLANRGEVG